MKELFLILLTLKRKVLWWFGSMFRNVVFRVCLKILVVVVFVVIVVVVIVVVIVAAPVIVVVVS